MKDLFSALPKLLKTVPNSPEVRQAVLFAAWRRAAGPQLCEHTEPLGVENDKLTVAVADRNWKRQLGSLAPQMIFRLNGALGDACVRYIEFVIDPDAVAAARNCAGTDKGASDDLAAEVPSELDERAAAIKDKSLRRAFLQAAGSSISHNRKYGR